MPESTTSVTDTLSTLRLALAGRYRVEREIGAGGMATVYLAQEERYDRRVAIKVLRPELTASVGAERFLREIKVTAALQHPHILPLYDSGEAAGLVYYVMPYVEGESLRARLDRVKQLPLDDALEVARSVASALDYAHRRGVIHRDIKPENILLAGDTRDNVHGLQALVADFGVAVAMETAGARLTASGLSLGTPAYMSPEQAAAERHLGAQSDVYALGVVLYEMLTGEPPFTGPTAQAVVAKLMHELPAPLRLRRTTVPPRVEAAVMKSLEKTPADRYSSAARFAEALQLDGDAGVAGGAREAARRRGVSFALPWVLAAALAIVAVGLVVRNARAPASSVGGDGATHLAAMVPEGLVPNWLGGVAVGAQGRILAFVATGTNGHSALYVKRLEEPNVSALAGTEGGLYPFFSPDGNWLAFFSGGGQLKKVLLSSGSVTTIADSAAFGSDAEWTADGFILFGRNGRGGAGIQRMLESGGTPVALTSLDTARGETSHIGPQFLPGRVLLYTARGTDATGPFSRVMVLPARGGPARVLIEGASLAKYVGGGRLVYQKGSGLHTANLNPSTLELTNDRSLVPGVAPMSILFNGAPWSLSNDVLAYGSTAGSDQTLVWVDRDGRAQMLPAPPRPYFGLNISPDGRRVALSMSGARLDVWIYDLGQDVLTPASTDGKTYAAIWTRDGQHLTTQALTQENVGAIFSRSPDGVGAPELLLRNVFYPAAWTKDGRLVVMNGSDISIADFQSGGTLRPLIHTPAHEYGGRLSPDERWLAYFSDATGTYDLYVARFPEGEPSVRVSRNAREAVWSHDGHELFFRSENGRQMLSVAITPGASFSFAAPRLLFEGDYFIQGGPGLVNYDVSQDGKRFLMLQRAGTGSGHLNVVEGWRQMIPTSGR